MTPPTLAAGSPSQAGSASGSSHEGRVTTLQVNDS